MEEIKWFTAQVQACEPAMYRLAMSILTNGDDAADAAQETICIAYEKLHTLRRRDRFKPWILRILTTECYAILRQRQRFLESDALPEPEAQAFSEEHQDLWQAVCDLSEQLRSVVVLYYYEGFSAREIGSILRISEANVKTRLFRARKRLRELLEG